PRTPARPARGRRRRRAGSSSARSRPSEEPDLAGIDARQQALHALRDSRGLLRLEPELCPPRAQTRAIRRVPDALTRGRLEDALCVRLELHQDQERVHVCGGDPPQAVDGLALELGYANDVPVRPEVVPDEPAERDAVVYEVDAAVVGLGNQEVGGAAVAVVDEV